MNEPDCYLLDPNSEDEGLSSFLHLHLTAGVGPKIFAQMMETFGSARAALRADRSALAGVKGIGHVRAEAIISARKKVNIRLLQNERRS